MRLLLDTHVFIWAVTASRQLKAATREHLASAQAVYVSAASIWEIAIKSRLGKIEGNAHEFAAAIEPSGFQALSVTAAHAAAVAKLVAFSPPRADLVYGSGDRDKDIPPAWCRG